ncbi:hypothetical protein [Methylobacterium sp. WL19]|uniref:hypothetical protein n=1 Tax=Methylobacterium sp. WL19 TaxID=2603896 RepID=UPI0011CCC79E|nr:hypothetical protein [Methylobacterium sp. WL19]TXN30817.1 hypothetical protein FV220_05965 [Methylobacterium sp. WL19]
MAYPRTKVRKTVGALLEGIPGIKCVYVTRRWPREKGKLPCLCVYLPTEDISVIEGTGRPGSRVSQRIETLRVVAVFPDTGIPDEDTEDLLDATLDEVERRLAANPSIKGPDGVPFATDLQLARLETGYDAAGAGACLVGALTLNLRIHHREGRSDTVLPANQSRG